MKDHYIVFSGHGRALELREEVVVAPRSDEVLIRTVMAGICGTDVHRLSGDLGAPSIPVCLGHEGVGIVDALGSAILTDRAGVLLHVGDAVYWSPAAPCGQCRACLVIKNPAQCENRVWPVPAGGPNAATFREFATVGPGPRFAAFPTAPLLRRPLPSAAPCQRRSAGSRGWARRASTWS